MKILFIIGTLAGGGAEKVVSILASQLSVSHKVMILLDKRVEKEYSLDSRVNILTYPQNKQNLINRILYLKKIKKEKYIDVSIAFSPKSCFVNVMSGKTCRNICSIRATLSVGFSKLSALLTGLACKRADRVIAVCESVRNDLIKNFNVPSDIICTVYNPCELEKIQSLRMSETRNSVEKDGIKIITHGRLVNDKGHCHLVRLMRMIVDKYPNSQLIILGQGPLREKLVELISKLGLEGNIQLLGFQSNPYQYLDKSDIYVFSSAYEGFPNALLDAMACDLPIISSDGIHGARELLAPNTPIDNKTNSIDYEENGILVKGFDADWHDAEDPLQEEEALFAEAICNMIEDRELREKYVAKSKLRINDFAMNKIVEQWEQVIS